MESVSPQRFLIPRALPKAWGPGTAGGSTRGQAAREPPSSNREGAPEPHVWRIARLLQGRPRTPHTIRANQRAFQVLLTPFAGQWLKLRPEDMGDTPKHPTGRSAGGALAHPAAVALKHEGDLSSSQALVCIWQWAHAVWLPK